MWAIWCGFGLKIHQIWGSKWGYLSFKRALTIGFLRKIKEMTYERLFQLKFKEEVPTYKLGRQFPKERKKISHIALLELPEAILRKVLKSEEEFKKLMLLKEWLIKKAEKKVAVRRSS